ncbi:ABC transporter permease [Roseibium algae]|uniref:ABC transporter permease subunit n=1 Tax=Roseibium algae TaxID=3123038 RepID=A0ABU8TPZ9_9HYPH
MPRLPGVLIVILLGAPIVFGLAGTLLPALGYLPALGGHDFSLKPFQDLFSVPGLAHSIALSFGTGLTATALSLSITVLFTACWLGTRTLQLIRNLLSPLLAVPHAAAAFGLAFLIAPSGFLVRLLSPWATGFDRPPDILILNDPLGLAMIAGLVMKEVPFLFLMTLAVLPQTDSLRKMKVASSLGYGRTAGFLKACQPDLYKRIRLPVLAVLAYSTSVVDMAQILGPTTPAPLAPRILEWMGDPDPAFRLQASAGALLQLIVSAFAVVLWLGLERLTAFVGRTINRNGVRHRRDMPIRISMLVSMGFLVGTMIAGILLLPLWSVSRSWWFPNSLPSTVTFQLWRDIDQTAGAPLLTTLSIGLAVTITAGLLVIAYLESLERSPRGTRKNKSSATGSSSSFIDVLIFLPLLLPQVSFLFGLQVLFVRLDLDGTLFAVCLTHLMFVLPYIYLSLKGPWRELDTRYAKLASSLGACKNKIFLKVRLPLLLHSLLVALAVGFAASVAQYLPTLMVGAGRIVTITTESLALASGGNRSLIALYGTLQLILPLLGFALASVIPALLYRNRAAMRGHS